ncbi:hypothetical protein ACFJIW_22600 [Tahibacter sp. UC22_41]|uniref:hypothetical protein n=1 Tax=Tahibacter sp. UC22_41 TaxID=3350178 RepID=UPI0036DC8066
MRFATAFVRCASTTSTIVDASGDTRGLMRATPFTIPHRHGGPVRVAAVRGVAAASRTEPVRQRALSASISVPALGFSA